MGVLFWNVSKEYKCSNSGIQTHTHSIESCAGGYEKHSKSYERKAHFSGAPLTDTHTNHDVIQTELSLTLNTIIKTLMLSTFSHNYFFVTAQNNWMPRRILGSN